MSFNFFFKVALALFLKPSLWIVSLRQIFRLAEDSWWRKYPFLPLPGRNYMRFRLLTQYGNLEESLTVRDVLTWLKWTGEFEMIHKRNFEISDSTKSRRVLS